MRILLASAALLGTTVLAGCATTAAPPSALMKFDRQDCAAAPTLASAVSVTPEKAKPLHQVVTSVPAEGACVTWNGKATPYVVYALPATTQSKVFDVGSTIEAARIFAPEVTTLDANGAPVRTFPRERYQYRGGQYSVQFEARPEERYVIVTAAADLVGKRYDSIAIGTSTTAVYTGYGVATWTSGVDVNSLRTFSYDGMAQASVYDNTPKKAR